ncbi:hypothetical protein MRB53_016370 [Persea americana]|uniref:Uncharacterized protein n=1 Tax=Persea americana TaxID=3435 RepID=A0ACC2M249_PERAE|nr:hypothetical protein MRB53_016370 [Persea americana]
MAGPKQDPLNGAYYEQPIPPQRAYHRPGRGSGFFCGPGSLLNALVNLSTTILGVIMIVAFLFWLLIRPLKVKVYVERASLTQFNLASSNTLHYNLSLDVSVRNPNKKIGIYYDTLEARAFYQGQRFDYVSLPSFYQGHKNTTMLYPIFEGQNFIALEGSAADDFNREKSEGDFQVDVKIHARVRFKVGPFKSFRFKPDVECELTLPLSNDGISATGFERTKCDIHLLHMRFVH